MMPCCRLFIMMREQLRCTLFPYTTLFRSRAPASTLRLATARPVPPVYWMSGSCWGPTSSTPDRKSTRLNSSHVEISYAVFCLKKKVVRSLVICLEDTRDKRVWTGMHDDVQ